jgi:hypothetical protein
MIYFEDVRAARVCAVNMRGCASRTGAELVKFEVCGPEDAGFSRF